MVVRRFDACRYPRLLVGKKLNIVAVACFLLMLENLIRLENDLHCYAIPRREVQQTWPH